VVGTREVLHFHHRDCHAARQAAPGPAPISNSHRPGCQAARIFTLYIHLTGTDLISVTDVKIEWPSARAMMPWPTANGTWISRPSRSPCSVQRTVGEAGAGEAADRFQHEVSAACAPGDDLPLGAVRVCEKAEVCPQLIAKSVQAGWWDCEYADAVLVEVCRAARRLPAAPGRTEWRP
jgi:hypothetical protein